MEDEHAVVREFSRAVTHGTLSPLQEARMLIAAYPYLVRFLGLFPVQLMAGAGFLTSRFDLSLVPFPILFALFQDSSPKKCCRLY